MLSCRENISYAKVGLKLASKSCGLDSLTGRAVNRYPKAANSNPARVNIFQPNSAVSDYHEIFLFMHIPKNDSEIEFKQTLRQRVLTVEMVIQNKRNV